LELYELIDNAEYDTACGELNYTMHIIIMDKKDYGDVYREIEDKSTFLLVDKKGTLNFFIKLEKGFSLERVIESQPQIFTDRNIWGPEVVVNFGMDNEFTAFTLEFDNKYDLYLMKKLLESGELFFQYIVQDEHGLIKLMSKEIKTGEEFVERLKYMLEFSFHGMYPRIDRVAEGKKETCFITCNRNINDLEAIVDAIDDFSTMGYNDEFNVYVDADDCYKIIFSGNIPNIEKLKREILRKINIYDEGTTALSGKPLLKYKRGLVYFFRSPDNIDTKI
jgi:hypothetical protein